MDTSHVTINESQSTHDDSDAEPEGLSQTQHFIDMDYPRILREQMRSSLETGLFSDVEVICGGKQFKLHRNILSMTCPYFRTMFVAGFRESSESKVTLHDVNPDAFNDVLLYLYSGELGITTANVEDVGKLADMFELLSLHEFCCKFLISGISFANCLGYIKLGRHLNSVKLEKAATRFALKNFETVVKCGEFLQMASEDLCHYINQPALNITREDDVVMKLMKWLEQNPNERFSSLHTLLNNIHIMDVDFSVIKHKIMRNPGFRKNADLYNFLNQIQDNYLMKSPLPRELQVLSPRFQTQTRKALLFFLEKHMPNHEPNTLPFHVLMAHRDSVNLGKQNITPFALTSGTTIHSGSCCCAVDNHCVYVSGAGAAFDKMYRYEVAMGLWQECAHMPQARKLHTMIHGNDSKLYLIGGVNTQPASCPPSSDILEYDYAMNTYNKAGDLAVPVRNCGAIFTSADIFVFGGLVEKTEENGGNTSRSHDVTDVIQKFDTFTKQCTILRHTLPLTSAVVHVFMPRDQIVMVTRDKIIGFDLDKLYETPNESQDDLAITCSTVDHGFGPSFTGAILGRRLLVVTSDGSLCAFKWQTLFSDTSEDRTRSLEVLSRISRDQNVFICCGTVVVKANMSLRNRASAEGTTSQAV